MKFDYKAKNYSYLGLIVKHGNINNVVFFWDENEAAARYLLEFFRIPDGDKGAELCEGFVREAEIYCYSDNAEKLRELGHHSGSCLSTKAPGIVHGKFAMNKVSKDSNYFSPYTSCEVLQFELSQIKPICTVTVERNTFYYSLNDLPCGDYIVCLKVEDRQGQISGESAPYYFHVDDAEEVAKGRVNQIVSSGYRR